ncbi:MAG: hypothetical protein JSU85_10595 [Candidatus Zixiibacteriota bacterium]|nr:MAG: hypothetical protein JSU85_10595 [candidate division Zixibacteria bacterium]
MNTTIDYLKSNRKWLVRDYVVWGDNGTFEADMIMTEFVSGDERIVFNHEFTGQTAQTVIYNDLVDHRGNQLPEKIVNPEIILIPKNPIRSFILGSVGEKSFCISKDSNQLSNSLVDLLIMEMN